MHIYFLDTKPRYSDEEIEKQFAEADLDGDGHIDFDVHTFK